MKFPRLPWRASALAPVAARWQPISVGEGNWFGHPAQALIEPYENSKEQIAMA